MKNLTQILENLELKQLIKILGSSKEYVNFEFNVFNVGVQTTIKNTDIYSEINPETWNGYDFNINNDDYLKSILVDIILNKNLELSNYQKRVLRKLF